MLKKLNFTFAEICVISLVFIADRVTKSIVLQYPENYSVKIFDFLFFTHIQNTGAAFGIGKGLNTIFIVVSVILIGFILYYKIKLPFKQKTPAGLALSLIMAGALGNLFDRFFYGKVVDFIDFRVWPVFNIADSAITIGAVLLAYIFLFEKKENKNDAQ